MVWAITAVYRSHTYMWYLGWPQPLPVHPWERCSKAQLRRQPQHTATAGKCISNHMATVSMQVTFSTLLEILDSRLPLTLKKNKWTLFCFLQTLRFPVISQDRPAASFRLVSLTQVIFHKQGCDMWMDVKWTLGFCNNRCNDGGLVGAPLLGP